MIKYLFIFLVLVSIVHGNKSSQYIPVSKSRPGIISGDKSNPIQIQLVYDPACSDTADWDKLWRQTYSNLDSSIKSKIVVKYITTIAPHHLTGQKLTQAILIVLNKKGNQQALKCLRYFLDNQSEWNQAKIMNQSINSFLKRISLKIQELWAIPSAQVLKGLAHGSQFDGMTRYWAKYAMGLLQYAALPKMYINGAKIDQGVTMTQDKLVELLKNIAK